MTTLKIHNFETTPEESKALLEHSIKSNGMIPGLHGVLAGLPGVYESCQTIHKLFTKSSFNKEEFTWESVTV